MNYLRKPNKFNYTLVSILLFSNCSPEFRKGERAKATVSSSSLLTKVWVTFFNNDTNQTLPFQNLTGNSPKSTPPLTAGKYSIQAMAYFATGTLQLSVSADTKDCADYSVSVDSSSASSFKLTVTGKPRQSTNHRK
jgi:hypothetical protein